MGTQGLSSATDTGWTDGRTTLCDDVAQLYCFER
jgi:hypothetical protein